MSASEEQSQGPVIRDRRRIDPVTGQPRQPAQSAGDTQAESAGKPAQAEPAQPEGAQPEGLAPEGGQPAGEQPGQARASGPSRPGRHAVSKPGFRAEASASGASASTSEASTSSTAGSATVTDQEPTAASQRRQPGDADAVAPAAVTKPDLSGALAERTADLQRVQAEYANYRKRVERDRVAMREQALASVMSELLPVLDDVGRAREHGELTGGFKSVGESLEAITVKLGLTPFGEAGEAFDPNVHEALTLAYSADVTEPTCAQILQPGYRVGDRVLRPARVVVAEPTDPAGARTGGSDAADSDASQAEHGPAGATDPADRAGDTD